MGVGASVTLVAVASQQEWADLGLVEGAHIKTAYEKRIKKMIDGRRVRMHESLS